MVGFVRDMTLMDLWKNYAQVVVNLDHETTPQNCFVGWKLKKK